MLGDHHETGLDDVPVVVGAETRGEEMADLAEALQSWHDDGID